MHRMWTFIVAAVLPWGVGGLAATPGSEIGTYYFPGWHVDPFRGGGDPWAPIRPYPNHKPLIGWYDDRAPDVLAGQAAEMKTAGIGFVVFDWYYEKGTPQLQTPMDAWLQLSGNVPHTTLIWCRHGNSPATTNADWQAVTTLWAAYAGNPNYYRIDGRPVFMIFDTGRLIADAKSAGTTLAQWVASAQAAMKAAGLPPAYFVAGVWNGEDPAAEAAAQAGFSAITAYNFSRAPGDARAAHGYAERDRVYRRVWPRLADKHSGLPAILPITAGWDHRPWGASADPAADVAIPTDKAFRSHLLAARDTMAIYGITRAVVCCWNEYGEGSIIEPTVGDKGARLALIKQVLTQQ